MMNEEILKGEHLRSKFESDMKIVREEHNLKTEIIGKENGEKIKEIRQLKQEIDSLKEVEFERYKGLKKYQDELHSSKIDLQNMEFELKKVKKELSDCQLEIKEKDEFLSENSFKNSKIMKQMQERISMLEAQNDELMRQNSAFKSSQNCLDQKRKRNFSCNPTGFNSMRTGIESPGERSSQILSGERKYQQPHNNFSGSLQSSTVLGNSGVFENPNGNYNRIRLFENPRMNTPESGDTRPKLSKEAVRMRLSMFG